jgi:hypothetical protein
MINNVCVRAAAVLERGGLRSELREALINDLAQNFREAAIQDILPGSCPKCLEYIGDDTPPAHRLVCKG